MTIQWNLLQGASVPDALNAGMQVGQRNALMQRQMQQQDEANDMRRAQYEQQGRRDARQEKMELSQDQQRLVVTGARVIEQVQPQDQAGWDRARSTMQQLGFDVSEIPPQFDPNYASQVVEAARAISQQTGEQFTLGEGQTRFDSSGKVVAKGGAPRPRYYPLPPGGRLELDPSYSGPVAEGATAQNPDDLRAAAEDAIRQGADPNAVNERLQQMLRGQEGGLGGSPSGAGFRP